MVRAFAPFPETVNRTHLPLVGRDDELRRLTGFWHDATDAGGLRTCVLIGESGIGKSRLIDEFLAKIDRTQGTVIHVRLYPEAPVSLPPIIASSLPSFHSRPPADVVTQINGRDLPPGSRRALRPHGHTPIETPGRERGRQGLDEAPPVATTPDIIASLRRYSHLHRTLLVIDDVHLLNGEPLREFATLVESLIDEPIGLLCATRPTDKGGRRAVERTLVDEIPLSPLGAESVEKIWSSMFGGSPDRNVVDVIVAETMGNPLAIRSALRGALSAGAVNRSGAAFPYRVMVPITTFAATLRRHVGFLADGMTIGLASHEIRALRVLAGLGEIFAVEAAESILRRAPRLLDHLIDLGILVQAAVAVAPIAGEPSRHPLLTFTHSLLHRSLAESRALRAAVVIDLIDNRVPIHALQPFRVLIDADDLMRADTETRHRALGAILEAALKVNQTADWELVRTLNDAADAVARSLPVVPSLMAARLIHARLEMLARDPTSDEHIQLSDRLLDVVGNPSSPAEGELLLHALRNRLWRELIRDENDPLPMLDRVDALLDRFPELRRSEALPVFLRLFARVASSADVSYRAGRRADMMFEELIRDETLSPEYARHVRRNRAIALGWLFESDDELSERRRMLEEAAREMREPETELLAMLIVLNDDTGMYVDAKRWIEFSLPLFRRRGQDFLAAGSRAMLVWEEHGPHGTDLASLASMLYDIEKDLPAAMAQRLHRNVLRQLTLIAGMREEGARLIELLGGNDLDAGDRAALEALRCGIDRDIEQGCRAIHTMTMNGSVAPTVARVLLDARTDATSIASLREVILSPPLRLSGDLHRRAFLSVVHAVKDDPQRNAIYVALKNDIATSVRSSLEFHAARGFTGYIDRFLERWKDYLADDELVRWRERVGGLRDEASRACVESRHSVRIQTIGVIQAVRSDGSVIRPRAGRTRRLLAVAVADRLLARPLSTDEFRQLLTVDGEDDERGRKGLNLAVHRLRETLGRDVLITDGDTPRLNLDVVEVDLLTVDHLLRDVGAAMREGFYARARIALEQALDLIGNEVVFAGLYDRFFEALREDVEHRVREAIRGVADRLAEEGSYPIAAALLERGMQVIPGDGELLDALGAVYTEGRQKAEAERVRMKEG